MKEIITYQPLLKGIIYALLVGQLWVNVISHCEWMIDSNSELIELCLSENSKSEEKNDKKEKDDKINDHLFALKFGLALSLERTSPSEDFASLHNLEIPIPPPKPFYFLS